MKKTTFAFAASAIALLLGGCQSADKTTPTTPAAPKAPEAPKTGSMGIVNNKCPMMLSHPAGTKVTVDLNGQKVGLCCAGCLPGWNKLTAEQKAEKLKAAM